MLKKLVTARKIEYPGGLAKVTLDQDPSQFPSKIEFASRTPR
jgi:hypothetical protein